MNLVEFEEKWKQIISPFDIQLNYPDAVNGS